MAQRENLTPDRIRRFACPQGAKQAFLWDKDAPRLAVRATSNGAKSFIFESKLNRSTIRRTIGSVQAWNLEKARTEARRLQTLLDQGTDPRELDREAAEAKAAKLAAKEAATKEAERRARYTLCALCETYAAHLERMGKTKAAKAAASAFKCHVFEPHPTEAELPAREVTPHQISAILRKVRESGKERTAGVLRAYLSAAFNAAKRAPFDSALPADLIGFDIEHNPTDPTPAIPARPRNRTLTQAELRAYIGNLLRVGNVSGPDAIDRALLAALLTGGQRMAQLLRAKVSDYNPETATLRLLDPKGKRKTPREHLLPLGPRAAALIAENIRRATEAEAERARAKGATPNPAAAWIFSTRGKTPIDAGTPGKRAAEISATFGGEPFDLRDVRRTVETMLSGMGVSKGTRAQLLSHGIGGVQDAHYDRHSYTAEKRNALTAWEAKLDAIASGQALAANVRPLHDEPALRVVGAA